MKYKLLGIIGLLLCTLTSFGQEMLTYEYAVKDTSHLLMDVYIPAEQNEQHSCMVFCFAGCFINGERTGEGVRKLKDYYTKRGWVVISIDYRQTLKGINNLTIVSGAGKYYRAISAAAEDLLSATNYILKNLLETPQFSINPAYIVTIGTSAGAITVLQADYFLSNRTHGAELLPNTFRYAGVMSFAGAIISNQGEIKYRKHAPAPTLFCHGTEDHLVEYDKIWDFNLCLYGTKQLVKQFEKYNYPYFFRCYKGMGHEVLSYYTKEFKLMDDFIEVFVFNKKFLQINEFYYDPSLPKAKYLQIRPRDMGDL